MSESRLKKSGEFIGGGAIAILLPLTILFLIVLFVRGMVWMSEKALPWLLTASEISILVVIIILLPMCLFRKTRGLGGLGCFYASYVFGLELWAYSCLFVVSTWGYVALIIGLFLAGVGVVPVAMLSALFHGEWTSLLELILSVVLTFGTRAFAFWMLAKADRAAREAEDEDAFLTDH